MSATAYLRGLPLTERIERNIEPIPMAGCWIWLLKIGRSGYGAIDVNGRTELAHRASWNAFKGNIPDGLCVLHRCDVRCCVNPDHLFLGTHADNSDDCVKKGRTANLAGEKNNNAILTIEQIREIKRSTFSNNELARKYDVSYACIWQIRRQINWADVQA